jgi:nucleoside-diphosphate-sugar epimerase
METETLNAVLGAGALGRAVMEALHRRGLRVRMVSRHGVLAKAPEGLELLAADLSDPAQVRLAAEGAQVVYHCAAPDYNRWVDEFPALHASILKGVQDVDAKLVYGDNLYLYGDPQGQPLHEDLPYRADTRKGQVRAALAEAILEDHQAGKLWAAIGRGSDFFGPWAPNSSMGERVFPAALKDRQASLIGRLDVPHTYTYIKDFGEALAVLGERDEAGGHAWHVPNDRPAITQQEFIDLIAAELGRPVRASAMSRLMMRIGGLFIPAARESLEMMYMFEQPWVVDSSRFEKQFGMQATPLPEAIRETLRWYKERSL